MRYVSLFSGIEGASVAWEGLGWEPMAFSEIEPFPCAVLAARFPEVPNLGDVTEVDWLEFKRERGVPDLVVGGSPCQSFSVAGKREGLKGASGLMYEYIRAVRELRPRWFLWENVPGALSVERGAAFGQLLSEMADCGYGLAWRVLDAQFCRVPVYSDTGELERFVGPVAQRRRRVFLVGCLAGEGAVEVLLEPEGMRGDTAPSRDKRQELARAAGRGAQGDCGTGRVGGAGATFLKPALGFTPGVSTTGTLTVAEDLAPTVRAQSNSNTPACAVRMRAGKPGGGKGPLVQVDLSGTLATGNDQTIVVPIDGENDGSLTPWDNQSKRVFTPESVSPTLNRGEGMHTTPTVLYSIPENAVNRPNSGTNGPMAYDGGEPSPTLRASSSVPAVAFTQNQHDKVRYVNGDGSLAGALSASPGAKQQTYVMLQSSNGEDVMPSLCASDGEKAFINNRSVDGGKLVLGQVLARTQYGEEVAGTLTARYDSSPCADRGQNTVLCRADSFTNAETCVDLSPTLKAHAQKDPPILLDGRVSYGANVRAGIALEELSGTLQSKANSLNATNPVLVEEDAAAEHAVTIHDGTSWVVRRLTPTECERLQGFPDGWTDIGDWVDGNGKARKTSDGARYKALGNSFAVPVIRWIGERIEEADLWL